MTATSYETDVVAWSSEQARLIRAGQFDQLDLEHIAEEIEDVGKSEQRELADPEWQGAIWADAVTLAIDETGMGGFPDECPWALADILAQDWLPSAV